MNKHKYLHELLDGKLPFPYNEPDYPDFDKRDTYNMNSTLIAWLYERLRFFQDGKTCIDLNYHRFNIDGEELTQIQCIDRMIDDCAVFLKGNEYKDGEEMDAAKTDLFKVLNEVFWAMWW